MSPRGHGSRMRTAVQWRRGLHATGPCRRARPAGRAGQPLQPCLPSTGLPPRPRASSPSSTSSSTCSVRRGLWATPSSPPWPQAPGVPAEVAAGEEPAAPPGAVAVLRSAGRHRHSLANPGGQLRRADACLPRRVLHAQPRRLPRRSTPARSGFRRGLPVHDPARLRRLPHAQRPPPASAVCDADRPGICRHYSRANEERIWSDFENMELNHECLDANLDDAPRIRAALSTSR